jgi:ribosomal protein S14
MNWGRLRGLLGAAMVFSASCYAEELADLRGQVERMQRCQVCGQKQLQKGLALALCRPPVRQLIDDVAQVCKREDVCLDQKIATLVGDADPTHLGRFVAMMSGQTHSVLYFTPKDTLIDGLEGLYLQRLKRTLQPQPAWLDTTKFLVVSNLPPLPLGATSSSKLSTQDPQVARAERRGLQIIEKALDLTFPGGQKLRREQVLHWVYSFSLKKKEFLNTDDVPPVGSDLAQSVWVFRIDCATPVEQTEVSSCDDCQLPPALRPL